MIVLDLRAKYYQNLEENISARLSKWHFRCPEEESEQKYIYFWKKFFLFTFVTLVKSSRLLAKIFQRGRHNWFLSIQWNVLKKEFLEQTKFLNQFLTSTEKNFGFLARKRSAGLSKLHSTCPGELFEEYYRGKTCSFFDVYGLWAKTIRTFGEKIWSKLQRMISTCSGERFEDFILEKKTCNFLPFPDFERKSFGLSAKVSRRLIKIAFNVSTGMFWGVFENLTFPSSLLHYEQKKNWLLAENFL